jgi:hypothetical protein
LSSKKENCDKCVTSKCKGCRTVFEKACVAPKTQTSVASCVAHHCKSISKGYKRDHCHKALAKLCAEQVCGAVKTEEPELVCPEQEPEPEVRIVEVRTEGQCGDCLLVKKLEAELDLLKRLADKLREEAKKRGLGGSLKDVKCDKSVATTVGVEVTTAADATTAAAVTTPPVGENPTTPPVGENPTTPPMEENPTTPPMEENPTTPPMEENPTTSVMTGYVGGTTPPTESNPPMRVSSTGSSSAAVNTMLVVGLVVGAAVAAGIAAVAIGLAVSSSAAGAGAASTAAPMSSAATNPLYQANVNQGSNPDF